MVEVVPRGDALPVVGIGQARAAGAARGEPSGVEREQRQQHHADPELGRRTRRQNRRHRHSFDPAAALPGEPGAGQHAEDVGDDQRRKRQDQRVGQHLEQDVEHRPALEERQAELALDKIAEVNEVLLPHRPIEAELLEHRLLLVGVQVLVDEGGERRARHQPEHEEQDRRDSQQRQRVVGEALEDELHWRSADLQVRLMIMSGPGGPRSKEGMLVVIQSSAFLACRPGSRACRRPGDSRHPAGSSWPRRRRS